MARPRDSKIATFLLDLYDELLSELCDEGTAADRIGDLALPRMLNVVAAGLEISTSAARRGLASIRALCNSCMRASRPTWTLRPYSG